MIFGSNNDKGIVVDGCMALKAVTIGMDGYTLDDVLVHDVTTEDMTLHLRLSHMGYGDDLPVALGVIRSVVAPSYEREYAGQLEEVRQRAPRKSFTEFLMSSKNVWEVK